MIEISNKIDHYFKRNFKKKFLIIISIPLLIASLYIVDFYLLPNFEKRDKIKSIYTTTAEQSHIVSSNRISRKIGYKYLTENDYKFTTLKTYLDFSNVQLTISPIFRTVKTVNFNNRKIIIASGLNEGNKYIFIICYLIMVASFLYITIVKEITENARLNLIYLNIFMFIMWGWIFVKIGY